jgi:hypothetical protein
LLRLVFSCAWWEAVPPGYFVLFSFCLDIYVHMYCWFPACFASLSCNFLIYTILTFDKKKKKKKKELLVKKELSIVVRETRERRSPQRNVSSSLLSRF